MARLGHLATEVALLVARRRYRPRPDEEVVEALHQPFARIAVPTARPSDEVAQLGRLELDVDVRLELRADEQLPPLRLDVAIERPVRARQMDRRLHLAADQRTPSTAQSRLHDLDRPIEIAAAVHQRRARQTRNVRGGLVPLRFRLGDQVLLLCGQRDHVDRDARRS